MQAMPLTDNAARGGPVAAKPNNLTRLAVSSLAVAGALAFTMGPFSPAANAQLRADQPSVATPFGRAPLSFADIVDKVKPAVVSVSVRNGNKKKLASRNPRGGPRGPGMPNIPGMPDLPDDHPLNEFFKNLPKQFKGQPGPGPRPSRAQGSGFVISQDGYVVTNNHVIDGAAEIQVSFDENNKHDADLVGTDPRTDLALLKIRDKKKFPYVSFSDAKPRVGDWVVAVGNPFGLGGTVTAGIVSAHGRDIGSGPYDFLQIDAAVNRGNSGGPTFNLNGEVVGVNTAIFSPSGGNVGIAFAVPSKTARQVIEQLRKDGTVSRGWLGVKIQNIDEDTAASIGLEKPKGALVSEVTPGGPAEASGVKMRDAIVRVNDSSIEDSRDLARKIADFSPQTTVDVAVWRNGKEKTIKVKLGRFPTSKEELANLREGKPKKAKTAELEQLGLTLAPLGGPESEGVRIAGVENDSDAALKGLKSGDVILEVQGIAVKSADDVRQGLKRANKKGRRAVLMHVQSGDQKRFVALQLKKKG